MHISPGSSHGDIKNFWCYFASHFKNNSFPFDLMYLACSDRNHRLCSLNIYFSWFWKFGRSRLRSLQIQCLVRPLPASQLFIVSLCLHMVDRARERIFIMSLLRKTLIPFMWAPPSWTDYFPKGPSSKYQHIQDWV